MVKLSEDTPLAQRSDQLLKVVERALLLAELATKQLDVVRALLSSRMQVPENKGQGGRADEDQESNEYLFDIMDRLACQAFSTLVDATKTLADGIMEPGEDDEED
jgi:hypothetical protein